MFWTIVAILVILWMLGLITHVTVGGMAWLIHILLVAAIIAVLVRVIQGRRVF
jgi:hypothetical protein